MAIQIGTVATPPPGSAEDFRRRIDDVKRLAYGIGFLAAIYAGWRAWK